MLFPSASHPNDEVWPLVALQHWGANEDATGVAANSPLTIIGRCVLKTIFIGMDGRKATEFCAFKLFKAGCCGWKGAILGGPALESEPLGLGFQTKPHAHVLRRHGLALPHLEQSSVDRRMDNGFNFFFGAHVGSPCSHSSPNMVGLVDWAEESDEEDPTSGSERILSAQVAAAPLTLSADELILSPGTGAFVPAVAAPAPPSSDQGFLVGTNDYAAVRALNGRWDQPEGMLMVVNVSDVDVFLERGDIVGYIQAVHDQKIRPAGEFSRTRVVSTGSGGAPDICRPHTCGVGRAEEYAHIITDEEDLDTMLEVELPTEHYYETLAADMRERHPRADPFLLEHLAATEPLLDTAIVSGFSFGVDKAHVVQIQIKLLGEILSRVARTPTDEHRKAIINYPVPIPGVPELRRFLGVTNWTRLHQPAEFAQAAKHVTKYLQKGATWPMDEDGQRGIEAIKQLTARTIDLNAVDELAALDGSRPLEQIADWNCIGWGGVLFQMSKDLRRMNVIGQWSGACTASQQAYHSTTGELFAQRCCRREGRRAVGRLPTWCWCDNKSGVGQANQASAVDVDARHNRWIADLESDGSRLKNLSGRSAAIADGLSRAPHDLTPELADRARSIREFSVKEFLDQLEEPGLQVSTLPGHAPPNPDGSSASALTLQLAAIGAPRVVRVVFLVDYGTHSSRFGEAWAVAALRQAFPWLDIQPCRVEGPLPDDLGVGRWFDPKSGLGTADQRRKRLRRDLLTSVAYALRFLASAPVDIVFGLGQGAVVAAAAGNPRVAEVALSSKNVSAVDSLQIARVWAAVRVAITVGPWLVKTPVSVDDLRSLCPEWTAPLDVNEPRWPVISVDIDYAHKSLAKAMASELACSVVPNVADVRIDAFLDRAPHIGIAEDAVGRCVCGRALRLLRSCPSCLAASRDLACSAPATPPWVDSCAEAVPIDDGIFDEPSEVVGMVQEQADSPLVAVTVLHVAAVVSARLAAWTLLPRRLPKGVVAVAAPIGEGLVRLPAPPDGAPYRAMAWTSADGSHAGVVQYCLATAHETVSQLDVKSVEPRAACLVSFASPRWIQFDFGDPASVPPTPLLAATHAHQRIRGNVRTRGGWVNLCTAAAAYTPEFSTVLARLYAQALRGIKRGAMPAASPLRAADALAFELPGADRLVASLDAAADALPIDDPPWKHAVVDPDLVREGREDESSMVRYREYLGDQIRDGSEGAAPDFSIGGATRSQILDNQWRDPRLQPSLQQHAAPRTAASLPDAGGGGRVLDGRPFRLGPPDGVFETAVPSPGAALARWVVVIPDGSPCPGITWKRWVFTSAHAGPFGGHRPADKTLIVLLRCAWWPSVSEDVALWCDRCWQCLQYRRRTAKGPAQFIVPSSFFPWYHVLVDIEGPSSPQAKSGATHIFEYICLLSHGVLYEPLSGLKHSHVRRAFCRCICRAGVLPGLIGNDRGPEFWNILLRELAALLHIQMRPATPYRPVEQAPIEREHVELRRLEGAFVHDVFRAFPNEWDELLPLAELCRMNTPIRKSGLTPRDIDRRWSLASPLERELLPADAGEPLAVTEIARNQFQEWRTMRQLVLQHLGREGRRSAALANRYRPSRQLHEGDHVLVSDPKLTKERAGRAPWKRPLGNYGRVIAVKGSKVDIRCADGVLLKDVHADWVVVIPQEVDDIERGTPIALEDDTDAPQSLDSRRSPGQMIEAAARGASPVAPCAPKRIKGLQVGSYVVYTGEGVKRCRVGRVLNLSDVERAVTVHKHRAVTDSRLRVRWLPSFIDADQGEIVGAGTTPAIQTVSVDALVSVIELHDGVIGHASARRLDKAGWRIDDAVVDGDGAVSVAPLAPLPLPLPSSANARLESLSRSLANPPRACIRGSKEAWAQWCETGFVDFLEVFNAGGALSVAISQAGLSRGDPVCPQSSYGRTWDFTHARCRQMLTWLVRDVLQPRGLHIAYSSGPSDALTRMVCDLLVHQHCRGLLASFAAPRSCLIFRDRAWTDAFGGIGVPAGGSPWRHVQADTCMFNKVSPSLAGGALPLCRRLQLTSNFCIDPIGIQCRSGILSPCSRQSLRFQAVEPLWTMQHRCPTNAGPSSRLRRTCCLPAPRWFRIWCLSQR